MADKSLPLSPMNIPSAKIEKRPSSPLSQTQQQTNTELNADISVAECVSLSNNRVIVVTEDRVWVSSPDSIGDTRLLVKPSTAKGKVPTVRKLLDTAIIIGKRDANKASKMPGMSLSNWIWSLTSQYHVAHSTPKLMRETARTFQVQGRSKLAEWSLEKAKEETGHDRLALLDIQSLGYQAEALVEAYMPASAEILIDYFRRSAAALDPINVVGYAYTLERIALGVKPKHIQAIEGIMPSGVNATRCLRVHSSIGSDVEHVDEALEMIATLSSAERNNIAIACYETAKRYFTFREDRYPPTAKLEQMIQPFKIS